MQLWLTDVEIFATVIAALVHDYEHNGTTNAFHINTGYHLILFIVNNLLYCLFNYLQLHTYLHI